MNCINLKSKFGKKYRIGRDEAADHEQGGRADPWLLTIPCKYGHIYPWGGDLLAASIDGHTGVAGQIRRLACVNVVQDGDGGELTATFHVDDLPAVAAVIRPRCRRRMSDAQRQAAADRMRQLRRAS